MLEKRQSTRHGGYGTRLYRVWYGMKNRCYYKSNDNYPYYGGRGISVCEEWQKFKPFQEWAFAHGYADDLTLDRIDSNGDYSPENCRWVTLIEQRRNTRRNRIINGKTLAEWSELSGIHYKCLWNRLRRGWSIEKAVSTATE